MHTSHMIYGILYTQAKEDDKGTQATSHSNDSNEEKHKHPKTRDFILLLMIIHILDQAEECKYRRNQAKVGSTSARCMQP